MKHPCFQLLCLTLSSDILLGKQLDQNTQKRSKRAQFYRNTTDLATLDFDGSTGVCSSFSPGSDLVLGLVLLLVHVQTDKPGLVQLLP